MLNKFIAGILFATLLVSATGCATILNRKQSKLSVTSEPDGAEVFVNGMRMGRTPIVLELAANQSYAIEYRKPGYETITRVVNSKVGAGWLILDIVCGLVPVVVDAATGAWKHLDQKAVNVVLVKQQ